MVDEKTALEIMVLGFLFYLAVEDIKKRMIYICIPAGGMAGILLAHLILEEKNPEYFFTAAGFLFLLLLISRVTKGQLGSGDAFVFGMTGAGLGLLKNIWLIYLTFVFAFPFALFSLIVRKKGKKYEMPLIPFIFLADLALFAAEVGKVW